MTFSGAVTDTPSCWYWTVTDEIRGLLRLSEVALAERDYAGWALLRGEARTLFDQGRCGICGREGGQEVEDHCHATGWVRGRLCRSCNAREGRNPGGEDTVWARYRQRNPYSILGLREPYSGIGWSDGRPIGYGPGEWPLPEPDGGDNVMRGAL